MCNGVEGFEYVVLSEPSPNKKFHRIGWIHFKQGTDMQKAFNELDSRKVPYIITIIIIIIYMVSFMMTRMMLTFFYNYYNNNNKNNINKDRRFCFPFGDELQESISIKNLQNCT